MSYLVRILTSAVLCAVINSAVAQPAEDVFIPAPGPLPGAADPPDGVRPPRAPRAVPADPQKPFSDEMRKRYGTDKGELNRVLFSHPGDARGRTVLIQHQAIDAKAAATLEEDLSVMTRIFQKMVERTTGSGEGDKAMGIMLSAFPGSRSPQNIYLEGYGEIFLLNVRFPLIASEGKANPDEERAGDSSWDEARREVLGQHRPFEFELPRERPPIPYNQDQVDTLKKELLASLKDSSHIRGVKSSEHITVVVTGGETGGARFIKQLSVRDEGESSSEAGQGGRNVIVKRRTTRPDANNRPEVMAHDEIRTVRADERVSRKSTLTVRIKKADAEELAAGKITAAEFEGRAQMSVY